MIEKLDRNLARLKRHRRVRAKIFGTSDRPRLGVFRSQKHIYAQLIDDTRGITLASASSLDPELRASGAVPGSTTAGARQVGQLIAKRALAKGIEEVVFDRGGYIYHGRVVAVADAAREAGLRF